MSQHPISIKWLAYTFLIGLAGNACFSILTITLVSFSVFPFLTLYFAVNHFYGLYILVVSAWYSGRLETDKIGQGMRLLFQQALDGLAPSSSSTTKN